MLFYLLKLFTFPHKYFAVDKFFCQNCLLIVWFALVTNNEKIGNEQVLGSQISPFNLVFLAMN